MGTSIGYKNGRSPRILTSLSPFNKGMYYSNQVIPEGFVKASLNYITTDAGNLIKPRAGLEGYRSFAVQTLSTGQDQVGDANLAGFGYIELNDNSYTSEVVLSLGIPYTSLSFIDANIDAATIGVDPEGYLARVNFQEPGNLYPYKGVWGLGYNNLSTGIEKDPIYNKQFVSEYSEEEAIKDSFGLIKARVFEINKFDGLDTASVNKLVRPAYALYGGYNYVNSTRSFKINKDEVGAITTVPTVDHIKYKLSRIELKDTSNANVTGNLVRREIVPREVTMDEALMSGYNMLKESPYTYTDVIAGTFDVQGIILYMVNSDTPMFSANIGETIKLRAYYNYVNSSTQYQMKWEKKLPEEDTWTLIQDWNTAFNGGAAQSIDYVVNDERIMFQASIRPVANPETIRVKVTPTIPMNNQRLRNIASNTFDLNKATGMFAYGTLLGLYGVPNAENTIFFSDVEDASYFPYPHNHFPFDEPILSVKPYKDFLLVITSSSMHIILGGPLVSTMVKKTIVTNLSLTPLDAELALVIKDQIFFKAHDSFYILKPNAYTSDASDLRLTKVSAPIDYFYNNFKTNLLKLLNETYAGSIPNPFDTDEVLYDDVKFTDVKISNINSFTHNGKAYYTYTLLLIDEHIEGETNYFGNIVFCWVYDTLARQWMPQVYSNKSIGSTVMQPAKSDMLHLYESIIKWDVTGLTGRYNLVNVIRLNEQKADDLCEFGLTVSANPAEDFVFLEKGLLPNWQYLDTGLVPLTIDLEKRFREIKFTIKNLGVEKLGFFTSATVDGSEELGYRTYLVDQVIDPEDSNYGKIFITTVNTPVYTETNLIIPNETYLDFWELDLSQFPEADLLTISLAMTGKGRYASMKLKNRDEQPYELSHISWVYRLMNGR